LENSFGDRRHAHKRYQADLNLEQWRTIEITMLYIVTVWDVTIRSKVK